MNWELALKLTEYNTLLDEVAKSYELPRDFVATVTYDLIRRKVSAYLKYPVEIGFTPELTITAMPIINGVMKQVIIEPKRVRPVLKNLLKDLESTLLLYKAKSEVIQYEKYRNSICKGKISSILNDGTVTIHIGQDNVLAVCHRGKLINKEQDTLRIGDERYFYVNRITVDELYDNVRGMLVLTRTSIELPRLLLLHYIENKWNITCEKRLPGIRSLLHSQFPIPKKLLYRASAELCGEFIKVRYDG